jgi:hypothetical protein
MEDETEAITVTPPTTLAARPTTPRALVMAEALKEDTEQRVILAEYVEHHMTEGVDYGAIPGTPQEVEIFVGGKKKKMRKNNLLKPGAEKLLDLFRCRAEYEFLSRDVDREAGLYSYEIRCRAVNRETGTVLNEGLGSASSFESKHRYRNSERVCPQCGKPNIRKSKPPKEGWYCWGKTGGCDANFPKDDPDILDQEIGKMVNPDLADVANTVLKMAKKRAQVDCAIALARVSDIFAQDVEDFEAPEGPRQSRPNREPPKAQAAPPEPARNAMQNRIRALWDEAVARLGKPTAEARWKEGATGYAKDRSQWTADHLARLASVLFPEEVGETAAPTEPPPTEREPGSDDD